MRYRLLLFLLLLLLVAMPAQAQDDEWVVVNLLLDQAESALENDDLSTAQSFMSSASLLINDDLQASCSTAVAARTLLDEAVRVGDVQSSQQLLQSARLLIANCAPGGGGADAFELGSTPITNNSDWEAYTQEVDGTLMALVPAGCFDMGFVGERSDETPIHNQCFNEPFWIDVYEVTNAEFAAFLNEEGNFGAENIEYYEPDSPGSLSLSGGKWSVVAGLENYPVAEVSWFGARDYCEWRGARLLTEREWEYAAAGPSDFIYPWGNEWNPDNAITTFTSRSGASSVGSIPAGVSWVGAYDMGGNVWEWNSSTYSDYPYDPTDGRESLEDGDEWRILRGGSWDATEYEPLRNSNRNAASDVATINDLGFRCGRDVERNAVSGLPKDESPNEVAFTPVVNNNDWEPMIEEFEGTPMALVPVGEFEMGSTTGDESPPHLQNMESPFYIDVYEVSNSDYVRFLNEVGILFSTEGTEYVDTDDEDLHIEQVNGQWQPQAGYEDHPISEVTFFGARDYCEWRGARLPTEREWEYAARGPSSWVYPWGDDASFNNRAVYELTSPSQTGTTPIGTMTGGASWVGAYDMAGNVYEWTTSAYRDYPYSASDGREDPTDLESQRVRRGGSWDHDSGNLRTTAREWTFPPGADDSIGFRCVRDLD